VITRRLFGVLAAAGAAAKPKIGSASAREAALDANGMVSRHDFASSARGQVGGLQMPRMPNPAVRLAAKLAFAEHERRERRAGFQRALLNGVPLSVASNGSWSPTFAAIVAARKLNDDFERRSDRWSALQERFFESMGSGGPF
jgi:hypothetical protein